MYKNNQFSILCKELLCIVTHSQNVCDKVDVIYELERNKNNITGDKAEVFYTDILKKYKFMEFPFGEIFILYKKILQGDKYLAIVAISPHDRW